MREKPNRRQPRHDARPGRPGGVRAVLGGVAGPVLLVQVLVVLLLVVAAVVALVLQARTDPRQEVRARSPAAAEAFAHAPGRTVDRADGLAGRELPVVIGAGLVALALATGVTGYAVRRLRRQTHGLGPAEMTRMYEHHDAVLHAVREGVLIVGEGDRLLLANDEARRLLDLPPDAEGRPVTELGLDERTAALLLAHRAVDDRMLPAGPRLLAVNVRPAGAGSVATLRDSTELRALAGRAEVAQDRLRLLYEAGAAVGTTLDVTTTARELAELATAGFADYASVDLADPVLHGEEPPPPVAGAPVELRRVARSGAPDDSPLYRTGELIGFAAPTPPAVGFVSGRPVLVPDLAADPGWRTQQRTRETLEHGLGSLITVPLKARGLLLGIVNLWRLRGSGPFDEGDLALAEELAARAAVCIDNARRFTREHAVAVALQRSLLPGATPAQNALEVEARYLPARSGVGGDWYDVIPLPGARVALVVGDVVGHGLHAAATMGRLRTAVRNFATLDLPPDELLGHLDELVTLIEEEADDEAPVAGATCLYAVYDPTRGTCVLARAGHPSPALVHPEGTVDYPELPAGPSLGIGGMPFRSAELTLAEGSGLVLFTDGLLTGERPEDSSGDRLAVLAAALAHPGRTPAETCDAVLEAMRPDRHGDDVVLLVARTRRLAADRIAEWDVPVDPAAVAAVRAGATAQLIRWGLDEAVFTTELVLSELVTNAIRYGRPPIRLRLLHDRGLICEVSDGSSTSPHLRYAADEDEGGRGLFLVAQLTDRWGTRYSPRGKTIWAEQSLD
ncbi:SpoIIE family protein phosphatase [Kitasatospora sp. NPDC096077]|uniref:SpoIIE family protein phosphatase n=1 Tax=Kitasatospora sp. NPDC096077 TaxID=3155544 RepID=UPI00331E5806